MSEPEQFLVNNALCEHLTEEIVSLRAKLAVAEASAGMWKENARINAVALDSERGALIGSSTRSAILAERQRCEKIVTMFGRPDIAEEIRRGSC